MSDSLKDLIELLKQESRFIVGTHVAPDPDAIGSAAGLALALRSLGKQAEVYLGDSLSSRISWAVPDGMLIDQIPQGVEFVAIVTDTATQPRISGDGERFLQLAKSSVNIDHHVSNTLWADINFIDGKAAATASMTLELLEELGVEFTPEMARLLMMGIVDDTGSFRFGNTTEKTLERAARLVSYGASLSEIANHLYFSIPRNQISLKAEALQKVDYFCDGKFAFTSVDSKMLEKHCAVADDTEGIVDAIRAVEGVLVAVFARQVEGGWKLSLRSCTPDISVLQVASEFGGGGHEMASGAKATSSLEEIKVKLVQLFSPLIKSIS